jgi:hypothetical protein
MTGFRRPYKLVRQAAVIFLSSGRRILPTMEEVMKRDAVWDAEVVSYAQMILDADPSRGDKPRGNK